jgi:hypothetical protein
MCKYTHPDLYIGHYIALQLFKNNTISATWWIRRRSGMECETLDESEVNVVSMLREDQRVELCKDTAAACMSRCSRIERVACQYVCGGLRTPLSSPALAWYDESSCHFSHAFSSMFPLMDQKRRKNCVWERESDMPPPPRHCSASKACMPS